MKWTAFVLAGLWVACPCRGALIFSQDFSSFPDGPVSKYVSSTPDSGQWNAIGVSDTAGASVSIVNGALQYTRSSNTGMFVRTSQFNPVPSAIIYQFDLSVNNNTAASQTAATLMVGSGFSSAYTFANSQVHSKFAINLGSTAGEFSLRDITGDANSIVSFSGAVRMFWVVNDSGAGLTYVGPDSLSHTVADNAWDLWGGTTLVFHNGAAQSPSQPLGEMKFLFNNGAGSIAFDNFSIEAVPETKSWSLISSLGLLVIACFHRWLSRGAPGSRAN